MKEELLEIIDSIESIEFSMQLPVADSIHLKCLKSFLLELKDKLINISELKD